LERQNKFLVEEVKTVENLEKKAKAENAINIHANDISSPKITHVNNDMRVMSIINDLT
jgi:hypothetical protein